jgi:hypothetical protein
VSDVDIFIGSERFQACLRDDLAPETCRMFRTLLPWRQSIIHARWSGEACWIPLGDLRLNVGWESATSYPRPGDIILYSGGMSETEILVAYGSVRFWCKAGQLAGNPILTVATDLGRLAEVCREILWSGARAIIFQASLNSDQAASVSHSHRVVRTPRVDDPDTPRAREAPDRAFETVDGHLTHPP